MIFETLDTSGHEQVVFCNNKDAGLKAIIAIHSTVIGPALGGVRMRAYPDTADAVTDALRLSRTMTYKNALAGLNVGGGKAVLIGDPTRDKTEAMFRALGRYVDSLGGRYITAEDMGTDVNDMEHVYRETEYVVGVHQVHGGSGDPAPFTAYGALQGLMATLNNKFGNEEVGKLQSDVLRRVQAYASAQKYDLVVADAIYFSSAIDITAPVLQALQQDAPKGAPAPAAPKSPAPTTPPKSSGK